MYLKYKDLFIFIIIFLTPHRVESCC